MAESTISPESTQREMLNALNYQSAQLATGINLNKQISGQISSVIMNIGKVNAGLNNLDGRLEQINNFQKAINMNIGKVTKAVNDMEKNVVAAITETKRGQLNSSTMTTKMNILASKQDETNRILSDMLNSFGGGSKYDSIENKIESKDTVSLLKNMSESLTSIDETLKRIEKNNGVSSSNSGGGGGSDITSAVAGAGGAAAGYTAMELIKRYGAQGLRFAGKGLGVTAALGVADYAGGQLFGYGDAPDLEQDKKNQSRMNWANKIEDRMARVVEDTLGLVFSSSANELRKTRIANTTQYFADKDKEAADEARRAEIKKRDSENWNKMSLTEKFWSAPGRAKDKVLPYALPFIGDDLADYSTESREYLETKSLTPKTNSTGYKVPPNVSGFNFDINKLQQPEEAKIVEPQNTSSSNVIQNTSSSNVITGTGEIPKLEKNSNVIPYFPSSGVVNGITDMDISGAFNTREVLEQEQAQIERQSKGMTSGDMVYEAGDILYKASSIKFEAASIQFLGAAMGAAGEAMAGGGLPSTSATGPGGMFGGDSGSSGNKTKPINQLSAEEISAANELQKNGVFKVEKGKTDSFAGYNSEDLRKQGIIMHENDDGTKVYTYAPGGVGGHADKIGGSGASQSSRLGVGSSEGNAATKMFESIMAAETGKEGDSMSESRFIRTRVRAADNPMGGYKKSSAYGPVQMTKTYLENFKYGGKDKSKTTEDYNAMSDVEKKYLDDLIDQGSKMLKASENDPVYGVGGKGTLGDTEEERKLYNSVAQRTMVQLAKNSKDYNSFIKSFRGGNESSYFNKISDAAAKMGVTPEELFNQMKSIPLDEAGSLGAIGSGKAPVLSDELSKIPKNKSEKDASLEEKPVTEPFKNANVAEGVSMDLIKVAELAAKKNPELFGVPTENDAKKNNVEGVTPGKRTVEQQKTLLEKGWSKTMKSKHLDGHALDLWPVNPKTGELDPQYMEGYAKIEKAMKEASKELGIPLEWGGDWKKSWDKPHWQIPKNKKPVNDDYYNPEPQTSMEKNSPSKNYGEVQKVKPVETSGGVFMNNPTQRPYDAADPSFSGSGLINNRIGKNVVNQKKDDILIGANSPFAAGVDSYNPDALTPRSVMDHYKDVYSKGYQTTPNTKDASAEAASLYRSWSGADDLGADFPLPGGMESPMINATAGYENQPAKQLTQGSQSAAAVRRTENLKREEAKTNDRKREEKKREDDRMTQAIRNREAPEPKHPTSTRRQLDSVLVRHNDWWKNFNATA